MCSNTSYGQQLPTVQCQAAHRCKAKKKPWTIKSIALRGALLPFGCCILEAMRPIQVSCRQSQYLFRCRLSLQLAGPKAWVPAPLPLLQHPLILLNLAAGQDQLDTCPFESKQGDSGVACMCQIKDIIRSWREEQRSCAHLPSWQEVLLTPGPMCRSLSCHTERCWRRPWRSARLAVSMLSCCHGS